MGEVWVEIRYRQPAFPQHPRSPPVGEVWVEILQRELMALIGMSPPVREVWIMIR